MNLPKLPRTREDVTAFCSKHGWFLLSVASNPADGGVQMTYVTPWGDGVVWVFNIKSECLGFVKIPPPTVQAQRQPMPSGFDPNKLKQMP